jgi:hypothetical protein
MPATPLDVPLHVKYIQQLDEVRHWCSPLTGRRRTSRTT